MASRIMWSYPPCCSCSVIFFVLETVIRLPHHALYLAATTKTTRGINLTVIKRPPRRISLPQNTLLPAGLVSQSAENDAVAATYQQEKPSPKVQSSVRSTDDAVASNATRSRPSIGCARFHCTDNNVKKAFHAWYVCTPKSSPHIRYACTNGRNKADESPYIIPTGTRNISCSGRGMVRPWLCPSMIEASPRGYMVEGLSKNPDDNDPCLACHVPSGSQPVRSCARYPVRRA